MDIFKPWYLSRTIWASVVTVLAALAGFFGLPLNEADTGMAVDAIVQAVAAIAGLVAIFGRIVARSRIG